MTLTKIEANKHFKVGVQSGSLAYEKVLVSDGRGLSRFAKWFLLEGEFAGRVNPAASAYAKTDTLATVFFFPLMSGSSISKLITRLVRFPVQYMGCSYSQEWPARTLQGHGWAGGWAAAALPAADREWEAQPNPENELCHMQLDLCWGNPAAGPASVGARTKHFGCKAAGDCEEQAELKTKLHQTSWMRPPLHHPTGDERALLVLWGDEAQGFPE